MTRIPNLKKLFRTAWRHTLCRLFLRGVSCVFTLWGQAEAVSRLCPEASRRVRTWPDRKAGPERSAPARLLYCQMGFSTQLPDSHRRRTHFPPKRVFL